MPNEFDIQSLSGVLSTLQQLPSYARYVPNDFAVKSTMTYDLWARATIEYKADCDKPIAQALTVLEELAEIGEGSISANKLVWAVALAFMTAQIILSAVVLICLRVEKLRVRPCF